MFCMQLLKRRLTERKDSEEQCVLLLRKLGEPDDTLQVSLPYTSRAFIPIYAVMAMASIYSDSTNVVLPSPAGQVLARSGQSPATYSARGVRCRRRHGCVGQQWGQWRCKHSF